MADAVVHVVLEQLFSIIQLEVGQEARLVVGVRKEVKKLIDTLSTIQRVLKNAEEKQVKNEAVKIWLEQLREISYDAEDVLDEWNTGILISQARRPGLNSTIGNKVRSCLFIPFTCFKPIFVSYDIAHRIKVIRERLDGVARDKDQYSFIESQRHEEVTRPITSSFVNVLEIYGRDDSKNTILSKLLSESSHQAAHIRVISIVGMGGFGKTTLAQLVLKDKQVLNKFEKIIWVCVPEPFDLQKVAKEIIHQIGGYVFNAVGWESLHKTLCDSVNGKLFLLVLDDVWSYDDKLWSPLKLALDGGAFGSRIIVTTRDENVAKRMSSSYIHRLDQLSEDDCWFLFRHIAFRDRQNDFEKLEEVGKKISKKCKGVPLTARILASLMCLKESKRDWLDVLESDIWEVISDDANGFLPELFLSYYALPSHLKPCFLYCAVFKKDVIMEKDRVVKLWMAQGFIGFDVKKNLEKIGAGYFDNLAMRSFFHDFKRDFENNIISCKMHDLVHDFAQFLTKSESSMLDMNDQEFSCVQGRHLCASNLENPSIHKLKNLRTLRPFHEQWIGKMPFELFHQLACLKALDLHGSDLEELPVEVGRLLCLRYLDLSRTKLKELPKTICSLLNLQTLKLYQCSHLCKLPERIGELSNLRHLEIEMTSALSYLPRSIHRLCSLRTLSKFIVGGKSGCKFEELKHLDHLGGDLQISGFDQVVDANEVAQAELKKKKNLRGLLLKFEDVFEEQIKISMTIILEGLEPPQELQILEIYNYPGSRLPYWISSLSNLVRLRLSACGECIRLPCLGKLASLEDLHLVSLSSVKHIGCEFYGINTSCNNTDEDLTVFPRLKTLRIVRMTELEEWELPISKSRKVMPCLSRLAVSVCDKLRALPALGKLESLESLTVEKLCSVKHVGHEFLGIQNGDDGYSSIFPKLKKLEFREMENWEVWDMMPLEKDEQEIFPNLIQLVLDHCTHLRALPALGRLKSLETLEIESLDSVKHMGLEFLGISDFKDDDVGCTNRVVIFPKLKLLHFEHMGGWEDEMLTRENHQQGFTTIMPCLDKLEIIRCSKLKVVPHYMFSPALKYLMIWECPELSGMQPCLPSLLEELQLVDEVGVLSRLLPISRCPAQNYPNLKFVEISYSQQSLLPEGFDQFTAIQRLLIRNCNYLDVMPEDLKYLTMLKSLEICHSPLMSERWRKEKSSTTGSHIPKIIIDFQEVTCS